MAWPDIRIRLIATFATIARRRRDVHAPLSVVRENRSNNHQNNAIRTGKEVVRTRMEQLQALEDAQDAAESAKKPVPEPVSEKKEDEGPRRIKARDRDQRCAACRCEARGLFAASFFLCVGPYAVDDTTTQAWSRRTRTRASRVLN